MKCPECGNQMRKKSGVYHYTQCGLDDVFLGDITIFECPNCDIEVPEISHIKDLHRSIAYSIATKPSRLLPKEMRFLRKHVRMKSKEFAKFLGVAPETYSGWETGKNTSFSHDRQIRMAFFILSLGDEKFVELTQLRLFKEKLGQVEDRRVAKSEIRIEALYPTITSPHFSYRVERPLL